METRKLVAAATLAAIPALSVANLVRPGTDPVSQPTGSHLQWGEILGLSHWTVFALGLTCGIVTEGIGIIACEAVGAC